MNWKKFARAVPFLGLYEGIQETGTFSPGDIVTAFGNRGIVKSISNNGMFVIVKFDDFESTVVFNKDGRLMKWHKRPSLRKV